MTGDASWSCLGLATCIGSAIRQIVDARVLLTHDRAPSLARKMMSDGSLAPPLDTITRCPLDQAADTGTCRAMAQTKPASSRAIAAVTTLAGLLVAASLR
jgi:hypothetical protein